MAEKIKRKNWIHYLGFLGLLIIFVTLFAWLTINATKIPIETKDYFSETKKIGEGLNYLISYGCREEMVEKGDEWICGKNGFTLEAIESTRDQSFATGKGKTNKGKKFIWLAIKNESWWNEIWFEEEGRPIKCSGIIKEINPRMFGEKFRYCLDENGREIDRQNDNLWKKN
jgi:hypothetical protein